MAIGASCIIGKVKGPFPARGGGWTRIVMLFLEFLAGAKTRIRLSEGRGFGTFWKRIGKNSQTSGKNRRVLGRNTR